MELDGNNIRDSIELSRAEITELEKMKENLKQAKDDAMQSWLDSRPLIDELEKMQADLVSVKERVSKANYTISEIQAQIGTTEMCIRSTKEEEDKFRIMINDKNQAIHKAQQEMEQLKLKTDQKRRRRSKLKPVLRLKRQSLQALKLTHEAVQLESEAFATSAARALWHINNSEAVNVMVQLSRGEYDYLRREASEQTSLAERRISVSVEEKVAAEKSRDSAFRRLQNQYRQRNMMEQTIRNEESRKVNTRVGTKSNDGVSKRNQEQQYVNNNNRNLVEKRKSSFFVRMKKFLVRNLTKYFK
ncbi:hypothetical protein ABFX02_08G046400 [Erythranthe guttata]